MASVYVDLLLALLVLFTLAVIGVVVRKTHWITGEANYGLSMFLARVVGPTLVIVGVSGQDLFGGLDFRMLATIALAKSTTFILVASLVLTIKTHRDPKAFKQAGMYAIFSVISNDLAIGLSIVEVLFPVTLFPQNFVNYMYLASIPETMLISPMGFTLMEIGRRGGRIPKEFKFIFEIGKALLRNPIFDSILIGLTISIIGSFWDPITIPIDFLRPLARIFQGLALFLMGFLLAGSSLGGSGSATGGSIGRVFIKSFLLCFVKLFVCPLIHSFYARLLQLPEDEQRFAYLYGQFPTSPGILASAMLYNVEVPIVALGVLLCHILSVPSLYMTTFFNLLDCVGKQRLTIGTGFFFSLLSLLFITGLFLFGLKTQFKIFPKPRLRFMGYILCLFLVYVFDIGTTLSLHGNPFNALRDATEGECYRMDCNVENTTLKVFMKMKLSLVFASVLWAISLSFPVDVLPYLLRKNKIALFILTLVFSFLGPLVMIFVLDRPELLIYGPSFLMFENNNCQDSYLIVYTVVLLITTLVTLGAAFKFLLSERKNRNQTWLKINELDTSRSSDEFDTISAVDVDDDQFQVESKYDNINNIVKAGSEAADAAAAAAPEVEKMEFLNMNSLELKPEASFSTMPGSEGTFQKDHRQHSFFSLRDGQVILLVMTYQGLTTLIMSIYFGIFLYAQINNVITDENGIAFLMTLFCGFAGIVTTILTLMTKESVNLITRNKASRGYSRKL